jgi:hypothetical protein
LQEAKAFVETSFLNYKRLKGLNSGLQEQIQSEMAGSSEEHLQKECQEFKEKYEQMLTANRQQLQGVEAKLRRIEDVTSSCQGNAAGNVTQLPQFHHQGLPESLSHLFRETDFEIGKVNDIPVKSLQKAESETSQQLARLRSANEKLIEEILPTLNENVQSLKRSSCQLPGKNDANLLPPKLDPISINFFATSKKKRKFVLEPTKELMPKQSLQSCDTNPGAQGEGKPVQAESRNFEAEKMSNIVMPDFSSCGSNSAQVPQDYLALRQKLNRYRDRVAKEKQEVFRTKADFPSYILIGSNSSDQLVGSKPGDESKLSSLFSPILSSSRMEASTTTCSQPNKVDLSALSDLAEQTAVSSFAQALPKSESSILSRSEESIHQRKYRLEIPKTPEIDSSNQTGKPCLTSPEGDDDSFAKPSPLLSTTQQERLETESIQAPNRSHVTLNMSRSAPNRSAFAPIRLSPGVLAGNVSPESGHKIR